MGKKLTLFLFILTVNLTVFGQVNLLPKRIVYQGDTGIFLTKKQEVEILKTFEYKEIYKSNLDSMFRYADNCTEALMLSRTAFFSLYDQYNQLESEAKLQRDNAINEKKLKEAAQDSLADEKIKKKTWRRVAVGEGILIAGAVVGTVTGAWVPVAAIVIAAEVAIILNVKPPKITMKNLFFKPE